LAPPGYGPPPGLAPPGYGPPPGQAPPGYGPPPGQAPPGYATAPPGPHQEPPLPTAMTPHGHLPPVQPVRFGGVLRSEWTKVRSIRSTTITMLITVVVVVGIGALICVAVASNGSNSDTDPTQTSLAMLVLAQLIVGIFGVMAVTSEYSSGTIRSSLMAVPRRTLFLLAKLIVVALVCLVVGEIAAFAAFGIGQAILQGQPSGIDVANQVVSASLHQPGVLRAVIGAGLYLTLLGLMGAGIGMLVRATAGGIAIVVAMVFIVPIILAFIPGQIGNDFQKYWPTVAGAQIFRVSSASNSMAPWSGFTVLAVFVAAVLIGAGYVLNRRDA
jgi:ABC-2 type transport system permease protein